MTRKRHELFVGFLMTLLFAVAIVRVAVPDRSRLRPLSVQGIDIPTEPIRQGETITREQTWVTPDDLYLMGWTYSTASNAAPRLVLLAGETRLFEVRGATSGAGSFPPGSAFRLAKGTKLRLLFNVTNLGPPGETQGANRPDLLRADARGLAA